MAEIDWVVSIVIGISMLLGLSRGVVREIFSIIGWVAAAFCACTYSSTVGAMLPVPGAGPLVKSLIAAVLIVIAVVFGAGIIGALIKKLLSAVSVGGVDRMLGLVFGFMRGALIIGVAVYFAAQTSAPQSQWWKASRTLPVFEATINWITPSLRK